MTIHFGFFLLQETPFHFELPPRERAIREQSGHKGLFALRRSIRDGTLFRQNAAGKVGR